MKTINKSNKHKASKQIIKNQYLASISKIITARKYKAWFTNRMELQPILIRVRTTQIPKPTNPEL